MTPDTLSDWLAAATEAARLGAEQLEHWRTRFTVREKARADLVTDADHASQKAIKDYLLGRYPDHLFVGEEDHFGRSLASTRPPVGSPPAWVVDPLDGTVNYAHQVPAYCVSIGLIVDGRCVVGVIHDPRLNEVYTAAAGQGAYLNGERIQVSKTAELRHALLSTGFPAGYDAQKRNLAAWKKVSETTQAVRRTGSTALNLAWVAAGRFDGYWAYDNWAWDVAGGAVLVAEAGGRLTTTDGLPFDPFRADLIATNGLVQDELAAALAAA